MKHQIILSIIAFTGTSLLAQDPHFTQFYLSPLTMNPAAAGSIALNGTLEGRATAQYRNQWPGLPGNYKTFNLGWDQAFDAVHGGFGLQYAHDEVSSGLIRSNSFSATYSYAAKIRKKMTFRMGIQAGIVSRNLQLDKLQINDQLDPFYPFDPSKPNLPDNTDTRYINIGTGAMLQGEQFYLGVALFNLNEPNWSFYKNTTESYPRRLMLHGGYTFNHNDKLYITPQWQFMNQRNFTEAQIGTHIQIEKLSAGLWYKRSYGSFHSLKDAVAASIGYQWKRFLTSYSYDYTIPEGRSAIPSSHEITLQYCW